MKLGPIIRNSGRYAVAAGGVGMYYQYGLWKSADETVENFDTLKNDLNGFLNSVPVVRDVFGDIGNYAASLLSPITKSASEFRRNWLSWDISWIENKDGIVKPGWNKMVAVSSDFLAYSPQTVKELTSAAYEKASAYMNSTPTIHTSASNAVPPKSEADDTK